MSTPPRPSPSGTTPPGPFRFDPDALPSPLARRRFLLGASAVAIGAGIAGCTSGDDDASGSGGSKDGDVSADNPTVAIIAPGSAGLMDENVFLARSEEYLLHATATDDPGSLVGIAAQLARAERDPDYTWNVAAVTPESLSERLTRVDEWKDTRDFDLMYMTWLLERGNGDTPSTQLSPEVRAAMEQRFIDNRYRYDDPLPADRLDNLWFWSENHLIIGYTIEYLAGMRNPDEVFAITGMTGAQHADRAKADILEWIHERAELGFFEWHSNVYMLKNITPLLMLVELSDDPEIVRAAAAGLDMSLLDVAAHNHAGGYTAPRGRTYKKDKMSSLDEATFDSSKLLFDDTAASYQGGPDSGATYLAAAQKYRVPQTLIDIATAEGPSVVKERHGVAFDEHQPLVENPEAPLGKDFRDPANLPFWWSLGGVGLWPMTTTGIAAGNEFRLWETDLFAQVGLMAAMNDYDPDRLREWIHPRTDAINFGFLGEANTYAYRDDKVSLASVIDHRPGAMRDQVHAWQAAIDENAIVFTNHPITDLKASTEWKDDGRPGYWTGEGSMPRSAQHERTGIHLYEPAWDESTDPLVWSVLGYRPYTHAYVPQDHFDQVVQDGNWTVAERKGAYIALWSWRTPTWRAYDPAVYATRAMTKPFDLVAEGGPDNVWIVEVATDEDHPDIESFVAALNASPPQVVRGDSGFAVEWDSPSSGTVEFSSAGAFVVDGEEQAIADFPRHESPWGTIERQATVYELDSGDSTWAIDADGWKRKVS